MLALREVSAVIALFVVLVCEQALAAGERDFSDTDEPVAVTVVRKKESTSLIGSCSTTTTSFSARMHSVKSKTASFSRVLMNMNTIETYSSKLGNGTTKHIGGCAQMADKGGFAGFSFIDGLCKMFSPARQPCRCEAGTGDLIYVRDSFWDKQDRAIPKLVPVGSELMEYVAFPSTVFDQKNKVDGFFLLYDALDVVTDAELMVALSEAPGLLTVLSRGNEWHITTIVDTEHCSMGCNSSSNFIVRQMFTQKQKVLDEIAPRRFFLSECGRTVALKGNLLNDGAFNVDILMSHKGYGCRWYTKEAKDHECAVTLPLTSAVKVTVLALSLDGNSSTCEGDSLAIYGGTPANGPPVANVTACDNENPPLQYDVDASEMVLVFTRSSKQHQADGFNLGFFLMFSPPMR